MNKTPKVENLFDQIRNLDQRLDELERQLRNSGSDPQCEMLKAQVEVARRDLVTLRLAVRQTADSSMTTSQMDEAVRAHDSMLISHSHQADWLTNAVVAWKQHKDRQGPDWKVESDKLREQCAKVEQKCDEIAAAVRPRGLRDGTGTSIANYTSQALEECFKLRTRMLEFAESQAVNSIQEIERSLRVFNNNLRQLEDHVNGFLTNRLSDWRRESRY